MCFVTFMILISLMFGSAAPSGLLGRRLGSTAVVFSEALPNKPLSHVVRKATWSGSISSIKKESEKPKASTNCPPRPCFPFDPCIPCGAGGLWGGVVGGLNGEPFEFATHLAVVSRGCCSLSGVVVSTVEYRRTNIDGTYLTK